MNVPRLRFKEFSGEWEENKLSNLLEKIEEKATSATNGVVLTSSRNGLFPRSEYFNGRNEESIDGYSIVPKNSFTYRQMSDDNTFHINYNTDYDVGLVSPEYPVFRTNSFLTDDYFLSYINTSERFKKHCILQKKGGTRTRLYFKVLSELVIGVPSIEEQKKIGDFFAKLGNKIHRQQEKMNLLKEQKKGYMQRIFKQEIRFKDDRGEEYPEWQTNKLLHYLYEHKIRNFEGIFSKEDVLSVSGDYGIINQIKFQGRSFAGESVANYHVVHTGDIVYTKSPLKKNPYGIIKVNKGVDGIVSTLYAVYSCKENLKGKFLDYYFQLDDNTNSYLRPLVNKGAKNDMKVNNMTVLQGEITIPSIQEQQKIIDFLSTFDKKIQREQQKLVDLQEQKKGYMQQMFI